MFHSYVKFPEGTLHYINIDLEHGQFQWKLNFQAPLMAGSLSILWRIYKLINNIMVYGIQYNEIQLNELLLVQKSYNTTPYVYCGLLVSLGFIRSRGQFCNSHSWFIGIYSTMLVIIAIVHYKCNMDIFIYGTMMLCRWQKRYTVFFVLETCSCVIAMWCLLLLA